MAGLLCLGACSSDSGSDTGAAAAGADAGQTPTPPPELGSLSWTVEDVAGDGAGRNAQVVATGDTVGVTYVRAAGERPCELSETSTVIQGEYDILYAERGSGGWTEEKVDTVDIVHGISLAHHDGKAYLAYLGDGGDTATQWCGVSDLVVASRSGSGWSAPVMVQGDSDTGATCRKMQNVCNVGNVTGLWAAMAFHPPSGKAAIAFQDVHFGFAKEDWESADQELAIGPGGWAVSTVNDSSGGGKFSDVAFTEDGRVALAWYNGKEGGIWVTVEGEDGFPEEPVRVASDDTGYTLSLASLGGSALGLAFHSQTEKALYFARSDDGQDWDVRPVDQVGMTGTSPSLAVDTEGRPLIAYGRCHADVEESACHPNHDGVLLARWDGRRFVREEISGAGDAEFREGQVVSMTIDGGGDLWVVFERSRFDVATSETRTELRVAHGR